MDTSNYGTMETSGYAEPGVSSAEGTPNKQKEFFTLSISEVQEMRVRLRILRNSIRRLENSRYTSLAHTAIELAAMWLGDVLSVLGQAYPYTKTNYAPADETTKVLQIFDLVPRVKGSQIIHEIRHSMGLETDIVANWSLHPLLEGIEQATYHKGIIALLQCYTQLREARMWMGMESAEVKKGEMLIP